MPYTSSLPLFTLYGQLQKTPSRVLRAYAYGALARDSRLGARSPGDRHRTGFAHSFLYALAYIYIRRDATLSIDDDKKFLCPAGVGIGYSESRSSTRSPRGEREIGTHKLRARLCVHVYMSRRWKRNLPSRTYIHIHLRVSSTCSAAYIEFT